MDRKTRLQNGIREGMIVCVGAGLGTALGILLSPWLPLNEMSLTSNLGFGVRDLGIGIWNLGFGTSEKVYWFTSRSAAIVAYLALAGSVAWGLVVSSKIADGLIPRPISFALHQILSLVALGFSGLHAVVLLGDRFIRFTWIDLVLPLHAPYRPAEVTLGILGFYLVAILTGSFYVRHLIGQRAWRLLHYLSFPAYVLVTAHGILSGTDSKQPALQYLYLVTAAGILFLVYYRILIERRQRPVRSAIAGQPQPVPAPGPASRLKIAIVKGTP